jgi:oxygen-independent coproporphyrinogen-3 oxidase
VEALVAEIRREADGAAADTLYFGGGTPSLLEPEDIDRLVSACRDSFLLAPDAEITIEANPETVAASRVEAFRSAGVNRLSLGVQSLRDEELVRLSRVHSAARAREAVAAVRAAGVDNLSLDLMMWLPQQSVAEWLESVDGLIALHPEHASLYLLEVYPNAPLRDEMARARWSRAPDDDAADMYLAAMERLESAGYEQYEISNVARPGRQSRHNLKYWTDGDWLAFGCGAHSTRRGIRWRNISSTKDYISTVAAGGSLVVERRVLTPEEQLEEALFTGLRLATGVELSGIAARYGVDVWGRYGDTLEPFVDGGHLIYDDGFMRLSRTGMLLAHEVMAVFIGTAVR